MVGKGDEPARAAWKITDYLETQRDVQFDALDEWVKLVRWGKVYQVA